MQFIVAISTVELIGTVTALQPVIARAATQQVHATGLARRTELRIAVQGVVSLAAVEVVVAVPAVEVVIARIAGQPVITTTAQQVIVAVTTGEHVIAVGSGICRPHDLIEHHAYYQTIGGGGLADRPTSIEWFEGPVSVEAVVSITSRKEVVASTGS